MLETDKRILDLIDLLIYRKQVKNISDFCEHIEMPRQTVTNIRTGKQHFTIKHIQNICKLYDVNANWIFGVGKYALNQLPIEANKEIFNQ